MRRAYKLALVAGPVLGLTALAQATSITFLTCSDTHYRNPDDVNDHYRSILSSMNSVTSRTIGGVEVHAPMGVLAAGDLIDTQQPAQWSYWARDFGLTGGDGAVLKYPVYEDWGGAGHDSMNMPGYIAARNVYRFGLTSVNAAAAYDYSWDWGGVHFVSAGVDASGDDFTWLQNELAANVGTSGRPVVLMEHENYALLSQTLYDNLLKNYNVIAIVNGHQAAGIGTWNGIKVLDSNGFNGGYYVAQIDGTTFRAGRTTGGSGNISAGVNKTISLSTSIETYQATGGSAWGDVANWNGGLTPDGSGYWAALGSSIGSTPAVITLDGTRTVSGLDIDNAGAAYTIAPGTGGRLIFQKSEGAVVMSVNGTHEIAAPLTLANDAAIMVFANSQLTMSGAIDGIGTGLTKAGDGTLILSAANTYTGATVVDDGVLRLEHANALPGGIGTTGGTSNLLFNGGVVELTGTDFGRGLGTGATQVQFVGPGGFVNNASSGDRLVNLGGAGAQVTWGSGNFVPNNAALILGSKNGGTLRFQNPVALGSATQTIAVNEGTAQLDGNVSGTGGISKTGAGTLILAQASYTGATTIAAGTLQLGSTSVSGGDFGLSGAISGAGALVKAGSNTVTLNSANSHMGGTAVNGGTLRLGDAGAIGFGAPMTLNAAIPETTVSAVLDLNGKTLGGAITLNGGSLINSSGTSATVEALAGVTVSSRGSGIPAGSTLTLSGGGAAGAAAVPSFGITAASVSVSGGIDYVTGDILHVTGGGGTGARLKVTGVSGGAVSSFSVIDPGSGYTGAPTGVAGTNGTGGRYASLTGNADNFQIVSVSTTSAGTGYTSAPTVTVSGGSGFAASAVMSSITLVAASSIGGTGNLVIAAPISGSYGLTKIGSGTVRLTGANTFTGGVTVNGGTLTAGTLGSAAEGIPVAVNSGVLNLTSTAAARHTPDVAVELTSLTLGTGTTFDVSNHDLILHYAPGGGATALAAVANALSAGRLTSTAVGSNQCLAYVNNGALSTPFTSFDGIALADSNEILVKYTWKGDANFDGKIDFNDYLAIDSGYLFGGTGFNRGDFNNSGSVTAADYVLIDASFVGQSGILAAQTLIDQHAAEFGSVYTEALAAAVPEPTTVGLLMAGALPLLARRRRK